MKKRNFVFGSAAICIIAMGCTPSPVSYEDGIVDEFYVHEYGVEMPKEHWEQTGQSGQAVTISDSGIITTKSYYFGRLEGETTYTFPKSQTIERSEYYSQDRLMRVLFYYPSGNPRKKIEYDQPEHTVVTQWYDNGQLKSYEKWAGSLLAYAEYYDPNGTRLTGIQEGAGLKSQRDTFGLLIFTDSFKDGKVEMRTTYYPNGSPKEITPYKNGIVDGIRKTYLPGGEPKSIETWANGKQEGMTTLFVDGQKSQDIPYKNGIRNGIGKVYKDGAIVVQEQTWKDDLLHGPSFTYHEGHKSIDWYYKGNKVTKGYYDSFTQFTPVETVQ